MKWVKLKPDAAFVKAISNTTRISVRFTESSMFIFRFSDIWSSNLLFILLHQQTQLNNEWLLTQKLSAFWSRRYGRQLPVQWLSWTMSPSLSSVRLYTLVVWSFTDKSDECSCPVDLFGFGKQTLGLSMGYRCRVKSLSLMVLLTACKL